MNQRSSASSLYLIFILAVGLIARLIALNQSFWLDEAAQAIISQNPFEPGHFNGDFQPPLSYYLSHIWMQLGIALGTQAEWFLRLPSVAWGIATIWALYKLIESLFNRKAASVAALLLALAPFHIYYSQEFRMYSMLSALTLFSWFTLHKQKFRWTAVINGLSIFTHYFAFVTILSQGLYLIVVSRSQLKKVVHNHLITLAPFIFWLPTLQEQMKTSAALISAWPRWETLSNSGFFRFPGLTLAKFTVGMITPEPRSLYIAAVGVFSCIVGVASLYLLRTAWNTSKARCSLWFLASLSVLPLILVWIAGIWIPAASPWRIQFALPGLYAVIAVAYAQLEKGIRMTAYLARAIIILLVIQNSFFSYQYLVKTKNHREEWRSAVAYTDSLANKNTLILSEYIEPFAPMQWYTTQSLSYFGASSQMRITEESVEDKIRPYLDKHSEVVVYSYLFEISDPERIVEQTLRSHAFQLKSERDFRGVGIVRIYKR